MTEPGGKPPETWEDHVFDKLSMTLTETKGLVGHMREMLDESKTQSETNKATLRLAQWTLAVAVAAVVASVALAFLVPLIVNPCGYP